MTDGTEPQLQNALRVGRHPGKRLLDVVGAGIGLVLTFPLLVVTAMAVAFSGPGGVFFVHRRVGKGGGEFPMVKFRTLRPGTDGDCCTSR